MNQAPVIKADSKDSLMEEQKIKLSGTVLIALQSRQVVIKPAGFYKNFK